MPLLCIGPSVQNCHRHVKILDMSSERTDQSMRKPLLLLILVRCVLAFVILGLVLSLVFAQKGRTTDLNTSSMYTGLIKCPSITTGFVVLGFKHSISRGTWRTLMYENLCWLRKLKFCKKWSEAQSTLTWIY